LAKTRISKRPGAVFRCAGAFSFFPLVFRAGCVNAVKEALNFLNNLL